MKKLMLTIASLVMLSVFSFASSDIVLEKENLPTFSLAGQVLDFSTGEALAGVKVVIEETNDVSYTDFEGNFNFDGLSQGSYKLSSSYISYKASDIDVDLIKELTVEVKMEQLNK